jgi:hypothetical protein
LFCEKENILVGELDLMKFNNLHYLFLKNNMELTKIKLPIRLEILKQIDISNNGLYSLDFLFNNDYPNLESVSSSNNFHEAYDIEKFAKFTKLKMICIMNANFFGSLKSLKNLKKLELLEITNTNIKDGLGDLPNSVKHVFCATERRRFGFIDYSKASINIAEAMKCYEGDYQQ